MSTRLQSISRVRDAPATEDILIGGAAETRAVVLFVDMVASTKLAIKYSRTPEKMLATLDLLIPTLQDVAYQHNGQVEKNTGDGLLTYFGVGSHTTDQGAAIRAVHAAVRMMQATSGLLNALLTQQRLQKVQITVGADLGDVLIARIGVQRQESPRVAVGVVANRAAKIQESAQPGQIRIGEDLYRALPSEGRKLFTSVSPPPRWPFRVPKSKEMLSIEQMQAEREARDARQAAMPEPNLSFVLDSMNRAGLQPLAPLASPLLPRFVDPTRPYCVYAFKQRWSQR